MGRGACGFARVAPIARHQRSCVACLSGVVRRTVRHSRRRGCSACAGMRGARRARSSSASLAKLSVGGGGRAESRGCASRVGVSGCGGGSGVCRLVLRLTYLTLALPARSLRLRPVHAHSRVRLRLTSRIRSLHCGDLSLSLRRALRRHGVEPLRSTNAPLTPHGETLVRFHSVAGRVSERCCPALAGPAA